MSLLPAGLPDPREVAASAAVVSLPLRVPFRGVTSREALLVRGPAGWGEFAPFREYGDAEAARWAAAALESAWVGWPEPVRDRIDVNATVPAVPSRQVADVMERYHGCTTAKVKVAERGERLGDDIDRVAAVRAVLGGAGRIRVDANGGWSLDDARTAIRALSHYGLEYVEQPCASVEDLARLRVALARDGLDVLVAADESIRRAEDPLRVRDLHAADVIVVKSPPLGGVARALRIVADVGLPAVVSSALDSSVGLRAGVALAAALPELPYACGLGTVELLAADVTERYVPRDGHLRVRPVAAQVEALEHLAAPPATARWWRARFVRCLELLAAS